MNWLTSDWENLIEPITEAFYEDLVAVTGCGPFDGCCVVVAQALQKVIGGEVHVLTRSDDFADHAAVYSDGQLVDWDGPLAPSDFIARFNANEKVSTDIPCVSHRAIRMGDLENAPRDPALCDRLAAHLKHALASTVVRPRH